MNHGINSNGESEYSSQSVYLCVCLSVCMYVCLSVCLSVCLCVCMSVCLCVLPTVAERVNTQLMSQDTGRLFAVVHIGGKQRKVTREDIIIVDKHLAADVGQRIRLNKVP